MSKFTFTPRDVQMLQSLSSFGLMSTRQIAQAHFSGVQRSTLLRRLRKLQTRALIARAKYQSNDGNGIWLLTEKGASASGVGDWLRTIDRNVLEHDLTIGDVRLALRSIGLGTAWRPGYVLKKAVSVNARRLRFDADVVPDGTFAATFDGQVKRVALEVELSRKGRACYRKVFETYLKNSTVSEIWYVIPNERMGSMLQSEWLQVNRGRSPIRLRWTILRELLADPQNSVFRSVEGAAPLHSFVHTDDTGRRSFAAPAPAQASAQGLGMLAKIAAANRVKSDQSFSESKTVALRLGGMGGHHKNSHLRASDLDSASRNEDFS